MAEEFVTETRTAAAEALRQLAVIFCERSADDELLNDIVWQAVTLRRRLEQSGPRDGLEPDPDEVFRHPRLPGESVDDAPDSIVSGAANPLGWGVHCIAESGGVMTRAAFGPAFLGPPGRVHGGVVAAVFDDLTRALVTTLAVPAFTARLAVSYRGALPIGQEAVFRLHARDRDGRKLWAEGDVCVAGHVVAEAEALLIEVAPSLLRGERRVSYSDLKNPPGR